MRLNELDVNHEALILALDGEKEVVERLEEMGMGRGRTVRILRKVPMGGPYIVAAGATFIALRENEASCVTVGRKA